MTRNLRLVFGVGSALVVALALAIGPLVAGYALAGVSLGFIAVLMGMRATRAIGDWRLDHPQQWGLPFILTTDAADLQGEPPEKKT